MEEKPGCQDGATAAKEEKVSGNVKADPKDSTDDLCDLSLEDDLLLLRDDEEEDFGRSVVACSSPAGEGAIWSDVLRALWVSSLHCREAIFGFCQLCLEGF